jgi:hypothetical protein
MLPISTTPLTSPLTERFDNLTKTATASGKRLIKRKEGISQGWSYNRTEI